MFKQIRNVAGAASEVRADLQEHSSRENFQDHVPQIRTKRRNSLSSQGPGKRSLPSPEVVLSELEIESCSATGLLSLESSASALLPASGCNVPSIGSRAGLSTGVPAQSQPVESQLMSHSGQWGLGDTTASCSLLPGTGFAEPECVDAGSQTVRGGLDENVVSLEEEICMAEASLVASSNMALTGTGTPHSLDNDNGRGSPELFEGEDSVQSESDELAEGVCLEEGDVSLNSSALMTMINDVTAELESGDATGRLPLTCSYHLPAESCEHSQEDAVLPPACGIKPVVAEKKSGSESTANSSSVGFFGLSKKVPELLKSIRGIPKLYGKARKLLTSFRSFPLLCLGARKRPLYIQQHVT